MIMKKKKKKKKMMMRRILHSKRRDPPIDADSLLKLLHNYYLHTQKKKLWSKNEKVRVKYLINWK